MLAILLLWLAFAWTRPANAQQGPALLVTKGTLTSSIESSIPFEYVFSYRCASIDEDCLDTVLTDVLPPMLEYVPDTQTRTSHVKSIRYTSDPTGGTGGTLLWGFGTALPAGSTGLVRVQVQFKPGTKPGTVASNQAILSASNITPPVTSKSVRTTALGRFEMFVDKSVVGGEVVVGMPTTFALQICSPDTAGGVQMVPQILITDTLPSEALFIDAQGTEGVDWTYTPSVAPNQGGTLVFTGVPTVTVQSCTRREVTLQFNSIPAVQATNSITVTGYPEGCTAADNLAPHCQNQTLRTLNDFLPITVVPPYPRIDGGKSSRSPSSYEGTDARPGELVTYTVSADNRGYTTLTNVVVTDSIPSQLDLRSFSTGATNSRPVTVTYRIGPTSPWVVVSGVPFTTNQTISVTLLNLGVDTITDVRWQMGQLTYVDTFSAQVIGYVQNTITPTNPSQSFTNVVRVSSSEDSDAPVSNAVEIVDQRAIPRVEKASVPGSYYPLDAVPFTVTLTNTDVAHLNLDNPVLADLLPSVLDYITDTASLVVAESASGAPSPVLTVIPNFKNSGRTLLRWSWTGASSYALEPGEQLTVVYQAQLQNGTAPGNYDNSAALVDWTGPTDPDSPGTSDPRRIYLCSGSARYVDTLDMDDDGNTTEISCKDDHQTLVAVAVTMDVQKFVRGEVDCTTYGSASCTDGDFNQLGLTTIGGPIDYKLIMTNTSNVSVTRISLIDIFPYVGDTGVIDNSPRLSQWRPNLQAAIANSAGISMTIYYSTQQNPCREDLVAEGPTGCEVAVWTSTLPTDPTGVQAIKLDFCDAAGTNCLVLERNGVVSLTWRMAAPNDAPADPTCSTVLTDSFDTEEYPNCEIAWNSFGYAAYEYKPAAQGSAVKLLPSEPIKVGMRVITDTGMGVFSIGDL